MHRGRPADARWPRHPLDPPEMPPPTTTTSYFSAMSLPPVPAALSSPPSRGGSGGDGGSERALTGGQRRAVPPAPGPAPGRDPLCLHQWESPRGGGLSEPRPSGTRPPPGPGPARPGPTGRCEAPAEVEDGGRRWDETAAERCRRGNVLPGSGSVPARFRASPSRAGREAGDSAPAAGRNSSGSLHPLPTVYLLKFRKYASRECGRGEEIHGATVPQVTAVYKPHCVLESNSSQSLSWGIKC